MKTRKIYASVTILLFFIFSYFAFANIGALQTLLADNRAYSKGPCSPITDGLIFCANTKKVSVSSGGEVSLSFVLRNIGNQDVLVETTTGLSKYKLSVVDENGIPLLTKREKKIQFHTMSEADEKEFASSLFISHRSETLEPGKSISEPIILSNIYDFFDAGKYYLEISRKTITAEGKKRDYLKIEKIEIEIK